MRKLRNFVVLVVEKIEKIKKTQARYRINPPIILLLLYISFFFQELVLFILYHFWMFFVLFCLFVSCYPINLELSILTYLRDKNTYEFGQSIADCQSSSLFLRRCVRLSQAIHSLFGRSVEHLCIQDQLQIQMEVSGHEFTEVERGGHSRPPFQLWL